MRCHQCHLNSNSFKCECCISKKISLLQEQITLLEKETSKLSDSLQSKIYSRIQNIDVTELAGIKPQTDSENKRCEQTVKKCKRIILSANEPAQLDKLGTEIEYCKGKIRKAQGILTRELLYIFNVKIQTFPVSSCKLLINNLIFNPYDTNMPLELYNHNLTCIIQLVLLLSWYLQEFLPLNLDFNTVLRVIKGRDEEFIQLLASLNYNLNVLVKRSLGKRESIDTNYLLCILIQDLGDSSKTDQRLEYSEILRMTRYMYYNSFQESIKDFNEFVETASKFEEEWEILS